MHKLNWRYFTMNKEVNYETLLGGVPLFVEVDKLGTDALPMLNADEKALAAAVVVAAAQVDSHAGDELRISTRELGQQITAALTVVFGGEAKMPPTAPKRIRMIVAQSLDRREGQTRLLPASQGS
jgi:hypothetical protein